MQDKAELVLFWIFAVPLVLTALGVVVSRSPVYAAMNLVFAFFCMAGIYVLLREAVHVERFTSLALAASAGTFLHLSLSDILPDLHRRGASKWRLSAAMVSGVLVMGLLTLVRHEH